MSDSSSIVKIGVFYDGSFFQHVSNYYYFNHPRRSRIRISGLHEFIREIVAEEEGRDARHCQIVDCHLFKGRLYAGEATENQIYYDRVFDDILMSEGVVTHYLPLRSSWSGKKMEKGIDVWLALEAYELCVIKKFDVVVLIASDGDYAPLIRKINSLGSRMMVLSWEFDFTNEEGNTIYTRTSHELLGEASYPVQMHKIVENPIGRYVGLINNIFVQSAQKPEPSASPILITEELIAGQDFNAEDENDTDGSDSDAPILADAAFYPTSDSSQFKTVQLLNSLRSPRKRGIIPEQSQQSQVLLSDDYQSSYVLSLKSGYGFIKYPPNNLFFHFSKLMTADFSQLHVGDKVEFRIARNDSGEEVAVDVRIAETSDEIQEF